MISLIKKKNKHTNARTQIISTSSYSQLNDSTVCECVWFIFPPFFFFHWGKWQGGFCGGAILLPSSFPSGSSCFSEGNKRLLWWTACHHNLLNSAWHNSSAQSHSCQHRRRHGVNQSYSDGDHAAHLLSAGHKHICRYALRLPLSSQPSIFFSFFSNFVLLFPFIDSHKSDRTDCVSLYLSFSFLIRSSSLLFHSVLPVLSKLHENQNTIQISQRVLDADCHRDVSDQCHHVSINKNDVLYVLYNVLNNIWDITLVFIISVLSFILIYSFHTSRGKACTNPALKWVMDYVKQLRYGSVQRS